jgi:5,10-methylenetetrahydromethanopterin reductase
MEQKKKYNLGILFRREHNPENLPDFARQAEEAGFDELWMAEDCFYGSGIASAVTALASTTEIRVGVGILPAVVRNPVFTAMEIATIARVHPGRFLPGLGHGMAKWMHQIGAFPKSQLKALEESTIAIRALLAGEQLTLSGKEIQLDQAELVHPPENIPPISLGVRGPKSLKLSGRLADGTILAEYSSPAYVSWAKDQIEKGQRDAGDRRHHRLTVFAFACTNSHDVCAHKQLRPLIAGAIASGKIDAQISPMGILPQAHEFVTSGGQKSLEENMPNDWIDQLAITGSPEEWKLAIARLVENGADTVVLVPMPGKELQEIEVFAEYYLG